MIQTHVTCVCITRCRYNLRANNVGKESVPNSSKHPRVTERKQLDISSKTFDARMVMSRFTAWQSIKI